MTGLAEISWWARKIIKWGAVALVIIMIFPFAASGVRMIYLKINPPPPPPPTVKYGKLPRLKFPEQKIETPQTYKLETISGGLPKLADTGRVYVVGINKSRILELERASDRAKMLGFTREPIKIDDVTYKFVHAIYPVTMTVNLLSGGFVYKYDFLSDRTLFKAERLPTLDQAGSEAKDWLGQLGVLGKDLSEGVVKSEYLIATFSGEMVAAPSYSEANFVRTSLFRANKDDLAFVTANGDLSPVNFLFSGRSDRSLGVVLSNYYYSTVVENEFATYPLKPIDQAWSELTQGKGYVNKAPVAVTIRRVELAYYESDEAQEFIQPVYVFSGDEDFRALVSAVDPRYQQEEPK